MQPGKPQHREVVRASWHVLMLWRGIVPLGTRQVGFLLGLLESLDGVEVSQLPSPRAYGVAHFYYLYPEAL